MLKGINIHQYEWGSSEVNYEWKVFPRVIDAVWASGIRAVRFGVTSDTVDNSKPSQISRAAMTMGLCRDRGLKTQLVFIAPFRFNRTDNGVFTDNAAGRYSMGYTRLKALLQALPKAPDYIELENELTLAVSPKLVYNQGQIPSYYDGIAAFGEYVDLLLGELAAAREVCPTSKVIVGTVQGNYGFIPWLLSKGVSMDIAGYHAYGRPQDSLSNWFELGQNLETVFASWGLPISVNEVNGNVTLGQPSMGVQGKRFQDEFAAMPMVESIFVYEMFDSVSETGFGCCDIDSAGYSVRASQSALIGSIKGT